MITKTKYISSHSRLTMKLRMKEMEKKKVFTNNAAGNVDNNKETVLL